MSDTCDGCWRTTFVITTRTGLISDLGRTLPVVEWQRPRLGVCTRLSPCRASVVCITATQSRPKPSLAMNSTRSPSGEGRYISGAVSRTLPLVSRTAFVVKDVTRESLFIHRSTRCSEKTGLRLVLTSHSSIVRGGFVELTRNHQRCLEWAVPMHVNTFERCANLRSPHW